MKLELEERDKMDNRVKALKQELEVQLQAYAALEKKYADIEREYLAACEENRRLKC